ncbi:MAG: hypothetical protein B7Y86_10225 [Brevundimonas subvibrioides]|uniref:Uncharacterized protein n=1 Tax=Brevundimonas subvibrioides TaxID=74313 RepID=A0A258HH25_9CAUL|nr:hypothetical protein [Brevundimonas subvibrioides]OYX56315.1 MAG: hypothetical protein B7Y86_10225 [Brevundimonas subvibrioides]
MYPSDFEAADAVFTPVQDTLFLGLPPLLALLLVLLILAIAAGMYVLGRRQAGEAGGADSVKAPGEIYSVIRRYAAEARSANSNELKQKAEVLARKIKEYLGPLMVIGKELAGHAKALETAGEGKIEEPAKPEPKAEAKAEARGCTCGGHGAPSGCSCGHGRPGVAQPLSINQIYIGGAAVPTGDDPRHDRPAGCAPPSAQPGKPEDKPAAPRTVKRDGTHAEQIDALDKAVRAFNDYWSNRDGRVDELKAAQRALNRRPSASELSGGHGHSVGTRH